MRHRHVALLIPFEGTRFLLQDRRSMSKAGEEWGFFGGGIDSDETPEEAVMRESLEELDWQPDAIERIGEQRVVFGDLTVDHTIFACAFPGFDAIEILEGDGAELVTVDEARDRRTLADPILDLLGSFLNARA